MDILEKHLQGKWPDQLLCEDVLTVTPDFVAVVDGATDKSGLTYQLNGVEVSPGRFAALVVSKAITELPATCDARAAAEALSITLDTALKAERPALPNDQRPSCSVVLLSRQRRQVWRIGDCQTRIASEIFAETNRVSQVAAELRAAVLTTYLLAGATTAELRAADPGRRAILPLLERENWLAHTPGPFGYAVLDGRPMRSAELLVNDLPDTPTEVVLASDGYPDVTSDLAHAEARLHLLLETDPLCMGELLGTKALAKGAVSFDDRTWIRLIL